MILVSTYDVIPSPQKLLRFLIVILDSFKKSMILPSQITTAYELSDREDGGGGERGWTHCRASCMTLRLRLVATNVAAICLTRVGE